VYSRTGQHELLKEYSRMDFNHKFVSVDTFKKWMNGTRASNKPIEETSCVVMDAFVS
jgi:hypothetical protein